MENAQTMPAPWVNDGLIVKSIDHGKYYHVALVGDNACTPASNAATARLIAAAPKLLEALTYLKKHIECDKQDDVTRKAIAIAETAISAAKGN